MSNSTPNRGFKKAVDSDDAEVYLTDDLAGNFDSLDTHTHVAGDIVSGQIAIARIASGTPDGTKFVRDDGTLAVPAGGGGGGAPVDATYLVTAADGTLTNEIVVGSVPGGELGGTWAAPTVDTVHSGSSHAATATTAQAAAEATAAAALTAHEADTTNVHGITDTAGLYRSGGTDVAVADGGTGASTAAAARANLATNDAANLTTGTVPTARMGPTGTANSTSWLRGDQNWTQLAAADILTGTFGTARLGSGTADATKYLAGDSTFKTIPVLDTAGSYGPKLFVGSAVPSGAADGDVWLDTFKFQYDPNSGAWPNVTSVPVSNATNSYTRSVVNSDVSVNGTATMSVAKIAWTSGVELSDRRIYTLDDVGTLDDIEVTALLYNRNGAQQGLALRLANIGNSTTQNAYTIWNDETSSFASVFNVGYWKGVDGSFTHGGTNQFFESLESVGTVLTMVRASNVVTATVAHPHPYAVGDIATIAALVTSSFSGTFTLTSVSGDTLQWSQTAANETATVFGAAGSIGLPYGVSGAVYPHWIKARLVGTELRAKVWKSSEAEPSWSSSKGSMRWSDTTPLGPTGSGKVGLVYAHGHLSGQFSSWGPILVTRAETGWKVRTSGVWQSLQPHSL